MDAHLFITLFISFQSVMLGFGIGFLLHCSYGHTVNGRLAAVMLGIIVCVLNLAIMVRIIPGMIL